MNHTGLNKIEVFSSPDAFDLVTQTLVDCFFNELSEMKQASEIFQQKAFAEKDAEKKKEWLNLSFQYKRQLLNVKQELARLSNASFGGQGGEGSC